MTKICVLFVVAAAAALFSAGYETSQAALAQQRDEASDKDSELEKVLWDADQKWLCKFPRRAVSHDESRLCEIPAQVLSRSILEISYKGQVRTKAEMLAAQSAANHIPLRPIRMISS
jgi:hypothetical protein